MAAGGCQLTCCVPWVCRLSLSCPRSDFLQRRVTSPRTDLNRHFTKDFRYVRCLACNVSSAVSMVDPISKCANAARTQHTHVTMRADSNLTAELTVLGSLSDLERALPPGSAALPGDIPPTGVWTPRSLVRRAAAAKARVRADLSAQAIGLDWQQRTGCGINETSDVPSCLTAKPALIPQRNKIIFAVSRLAQHTLVSTTVDFHQASGATAWPNVPLLTTRPPTAPEARQPAQGCPIWAQ